MTKKSSLWLQLFEEVVINPFFSLLFHFLIFNQLLKLNLGNSQLEQLINKEITRITDWKLICKYFDNQLIIKIIFAGTNGKYLVLLSVFYHWKLAIFWSLDWLWENLMDIFFTIIWLFIDQPMNWLIEKIIARLVVNNENNHNCSSNHNLIDTALSLSSDILMRKVL